MNRTKNNKPPLPRQKQWQRDLFRMFNIIDELNTTKKKFAMIARVGITDIKTDTWIWGDVRKFTDDDVEISICYLDGERCWIHIFKERWSLSNEMITLNKIMGKVMMDLTKLGIEYSGHVASAKYWNQSADRSLIKRDPDKAVGVYDLCKNVSTGMEKILEKKLLYPYDRRDGDTC